MWSGRLETGVLGVSSSRRSCTTWLSGLSHDEEIPGRWQAALGPYGDTGKVPCCWLGVWGVHASWTAPAGKRQNGRVLWNERVFPHPAQPLPISAAKRGEAKAKGGAPMPGSTCWQSGLEDATAAVLQIPGRLDWAWLACRADEQVPSAGPGQTSSEDGMRSSNCNVCDSHVYGSGLQLQLQHQPRDKHRHSITPVAPLSPNNNGLFVIAAHLGWHDPGTKVCIWPPRPR